MTPAQTPFPDRDSVADKLGSFAESDQSFLKLLFENPAQDDALLEGLLVYLERAAEARFLNSLKLGKTASGSATMRPPACRFASRKWPAPASTRPSLPSRTA